MEKQLNKSKLRREHGSYWTQINTGQKVFSIITKYIQPDCIIEPFVGGGSLIDPFIAKTSNIIVNDINIDYITSLKLKYADYKNICFFNKNILTYSIINLINEWNILNKQYKSILIYSNPPFGASKVNRITLKKNEINEIEQNNDEKIKIRKIPIQYGADGAEDKWFGDTYGRGDLCIPAIAHMIEMIKRRGDGHLGFFSPFGVLLGRKRYEKLLHALLKDFEFLHGELFSGKDFENVASKKPIVFSLWKYSPNRQTQHESLQFKYEEQILHLKKLNLLKDGWKYNNNVKIKGEIAVQHNDMFNSPVPKMFHLQVEKGGSEVIPENVKIELNIPDIPSELVYALWSLCVGYKSITNFPTYMNEAYTHLPDFTKPETMEILAYSALYAIITNIKLNQCKDKINIINNEIIFGNILLSNSINHLLEKYKHLIINSNSIEFILIQLKKGVLPDNIDQNLRIFIRSEIEKRLDIIEYWNFIPIS